MIIILLLAGLSTGSFAGQTIQSKLVKISVVAPLLGSQDFQSRCQAPGVVKCVGFDRASDIAGQFGDSAGVLPGANTTPTIDPSQKAGVAGSSLRFTVTTSSANSAGSYFTNFSDNLLTQFDTGQVFYVQWRQRFDTQYASMNLGSYGNGGWKQVIVGSGDRPGCTKSNSLTIDNGGNCTSSCTALETVVQNTYHRGFPVMYNSCTGSSSNQNGRLSGVTNPYYPFEEIFNGSDFKLQNARPAPYCLYSQGPTNSYFSPKGNCFGYSANEWMTFKIKITIGTRTADYFKNSHVDLWVAREGQKSEKVFNWDWDLAAGPAIQNLKYGKVWFLSYNTNSGGNNNAAVPVANTWYDELVISTQDIADPK